MTERLYHINQRLTEFSAAVVQQMTWDGHPAVVLDRTAFYPASGGQPSDRGQIEGVAVLDVLALEDGAIVHVMADDVPSERVCGAVDWRRRFDHMQQHSGQHLLSAAFEQLMDVDTVGFHLGEDKSTIDLSAARMTPAAVGRAEDLANRVIWENRKMVSQFVDEDELPSLSLRRAPAVDGPVRIVTILGPTENPGAWFDANPCGGTHVDATGEIGLLMIVRIEYRGQETRLEFLCGGRALQDYATKHQVLSGLSAQLTVGYWELGNAIGRLEDEARRLQRELKQVGSRLAAYEVDEMARGSVPWGAHRLVTRVLEARTADDLRSLAVTLVERPGFVALLAAAGERIQLCFARSADVELDVSVLLRGACERLNGKGGGRSHLAQGSAGSVDGRTLQTVLAELASSAGPAMIMGDSGYEGSGNAPDASS